MSSRRSALALLLAVLLAATATAGCVDRLTTALSGLRGDEAPPPPADAAITPVDEAVGPGYNKTFTLDVMEGHARIVIRGELASNPPSPLPVKSPGRVDITLRDADGAVKKTIALGAPATPPATPSYAATAEVTGLTPGTWTIQVVGNGLGSGANGARLTLQAVATASAQGDVFA